MKKRPIIPSLDGGPKTVLLVDDVERSTAFYRDNLQMGHCDGDPCRYAEMDAGESGILVLVKRAGTIAPMLAPNAISEAGLGTARAISFTIHTDEYDNWKRWLTARHVSIDRETKWIHGGKSLYILDPDGRRLEFKTPPKMSPPKRTAAPFAK